jgi:hypothetical protein
MEGSAYAVPRTVSPGRAISAGLAALAIGGAVATGAWWLTDNDVDTLANPATHVIVADTPTAPTGAVAAKDEAAVAAAVGGNDRADSPTSSLSGHPEEGTAQRNVGG